jgi:hypothetical protein
MPTGRLVGVQRRDELVTNDRRRVTEGILGHGLRRMETAITSAPLVPHFEQPIRRASSLTKLSVTDQPTRRTKASGSIIAARARAHGADGARRRPSSTGGVRVL